MKHTALFLAVLLLMTAAPAALAADVTAEQTWTLATDGTPVRCGAVAAMYREELTSAGLDGYPVLLGPDGETLPAEALAATGSIIHCVLGEEALDCTLILLGDVAGTGQFNISQLVIMARLLSQHEGEPLQLSAADLNGNSTLDIADLVMEAGYIRSSQEPGPEVPYPQPAGEPQGKTLVVCYSATGTTERVAGMLARAVGGDLLILEPLEPYTASDLNYSDPDSRVSREHADPALRDVALVNTTVPDFGSYDTVFVGYPIWWGIAAWPVDGFLQANDFTGKDIWCFCTSGSSGVGQSATLLEEMAGSGNWLGAHRFSGGASQADVDAWIASIADTAA